jgi:hypothetical protein
MRGGLPCCVDRVKIGRERGKGQVWGAIMDWLRKVVQDPRTERFIMALIVFNAVTLGLETSESVIARFGPLLTAIDRIIIAVFVLEILARFLVQRGAFFRDGWNISTCSWWVSPSLPPPAPSRYCAPCGYCGSCV